MEQFLGIALLSLGGLSAASFYVPSHKVKKWSWETYWITLGFVAWIVMPTVGGMLTTPDLWGIFLRQQHKQHGMVVCVRRPVGIRRADVRPGIATSSASRSVSRSRSASVRLSAHSCPPSSTERSACWSPHFRAALSCWDSSCVWPASHFAAMQECSRSDCSRTSRKGNRSRISPSPRVSSSPCWAAS